MKYKLTYATDWQIVQSTAVSRPAVWRCRCVHPWLPSIWLSSSCWIGSPCAFLFCTTAWTGSRPTRTYTPRRPGLSIWWSRVFPMTAGGLGVSIDAIDLWSAEVVPGTARRTSTSSDLQARPPLPHYTCSGGVAGGHRVRRITTCRDLCPEREDGHHPVGARPGPLAAVHTPDLITADPVTRRSTSPTQQHQPRRCRQAPVTAATIAPMGVLHPSWPSWKAAAYAFVNDLDRSA